MLPEFTAKGYLPKGIHVVSGKELLEKLLSNEYRRGFGKSITDILDWAKYKRATSLFIGGSFVSNDERPHDIDCLIVFRNDDAIPHKTEMLTIESTKIDIQFCAESDRKLVDTFVYLLTHTRSQDEIGLVQVDLYGHGEPWQILHEPNEEDVEIVKRAYIHRHYIDHYEPNGILVTIHGLLSDARWNAEIAPITSSQNWIFAPFIYFDHNGPGLLLDQAKAKEVINRFRDWIYDLQARYPFGISVLAHSFGTYILASYITGFGEFTPVQFNSVILTGSILNPNFDWEPHRGAKVARVLNEIAPNDQWVKHMPKLQWITSDLLYGNSGTTGFVKPCEILTQKSNDIFDHNNVIKRDVIERYWMPYLMMNREVRRDEVDKYFARKIGSRSGDGQTKT